MVGTTDFLEGRHFSYVSDVFSFGSFFQMANNLTFTTMILNRDLLIIQRYKFHVLKVKKLNFFAGVFGFLQLCFWKW